MKKIISTIIAIPLILSSSNIAFATSSNQSKLYTYQMDVNYNWNIEKSIKFNNTQSEGEKLQKIIDTIEKNNFQNLEIKLIKIDKDIAYIDLRESESSETTWQQIMSGSTGGIIKSQEILCNMLQPNNHEEWIDGVYITYEGSSEEEQSGFDHAGVGFFGTVNTKEDLLTRDKKPISIFEDTKGHWAQKEIEIFYSKDYIGRYLDKMFKPENNITRAEFVKIFNRYFGLSKSSDKVFEDTKNHWAKEEIDIAVTNGVCSGKLKDEFRPNDFITREEAACMIANYKKIYDNNLDKLNGYKDGLKTSSWARTALEGIIENGYMKGYSDNTFKPKENISRAEVVVTLSRIK